MRENKEKSIYFEKNLGSLILDEKFVFSYFKRTVEAAVQKPKLVKHITHRPVLGNSAKK